MIDFSNATLQDLAEYFSNLTMDQLRGDLTIAISPDRHTIQHIPAPHIFGSNNVVQIADFLQNNDNLNNVVNGYLNEYQEDFESLLEDSPNPNNIDPLLALLRTTIGAKILAIILLPESEDDPMLELTVNVIDKWIVGEHFSPETRHQNVINLLYGCSNNNALAVTIEILAFPSVFNVILDRYFSKQTPNPAAARDFLVGILNNYDDDIQSQRRGQLLVSTLLSNDEILEFYCENQAFRLMLSASNNPVLRNIDQNTLRPYYQNWLLQHQSEEHAAASDDAAVPFTP